MSLPPFPEAPYQGVQREMLENELLAVIRHRDVTLQDLQQLYDRTYAALGQAIAAGLFVPVGPALAVYHGDPQGTFDLEVGYPAQSVPTQSVPTAAGDLHASALPAGPIAIASHIGPYDGLGDAWAALVAGAGDAKPTGVWIEVYVSSPVTTPAAELRTDLVMPVTA